MSSKRQQSNNSQPPRTPPVAPDAPVVAARPPEREAPPPKDRVGDILRRQREKSGFDIYRIADHLCIKSGFLIALENSQYDAFPADAYVIGFLRSYGTYLGLDGKDIIDRYRHEMAGRRKKPVLTMPSPVTEGRAPSAIIITGALIAAILVYAIWYGISSTDRTSLSKPTPLPPAATIDTTPKNDTASIDIQAPAPAATTITATVPVPAPVATPAPAPAPTVAATPEPVANAKPTVQAAATIAPAVTTKAKTSPAPAVAVVEQPAAPAPVATVAAPSGVVIRAASPSWVLITDATGKSLIDRVLKAGEVYKVPDGKGLTLTTGNSNGISLSLDGIVLPKLPNPADGSRVLRNISLEPSRLKNMPVPAAD